MPKLHIGSFQRMKFLNKSAILNTIRLKGPISRAEIAKLTRLTPPTVTNLVGELLESGLIMEHELGPSTGGRKPIMLSINSASFYGIGVYIGAKRIEAISADLDGKIAIAKVKDIPVPPSKESLLAMLEQIIRQVIEETSVHDKAFLGIGIGMHGLVDPEQGISIFAPHLNLHQIPLKELLEEKFNLPVEVENDVRALAIGESWFGQGQGIANFICLHVGTGIGAGVVINDKVYHGSSYTAGEIGHTTIDMDGPRCNCGNYGCLEALASGPAIVHRAKKELLAGKASLLLDWITLHPNSLNAKMVYQAAQEGDALAIKLLQDTGKYLGIALANVINSFNPKKIILSGGIFKAGNYVIDPLIRTMNERALRTPVEKVSIVHSELGDQGVAIGAFTLVLQKLFDLKKD